MKSKNKTNTPSINPDNYGTQFMAWWKEMQPEWRSKMDRDASGTLKQDTPADEDWQALKKGGSAGMYIAVMGLSWWVKAQTTVSDHSNDAWTAVADLLWVFRQINNINSPDNSPGPSSAKRVHDDDKEESQLRKKCVISLSVMDTMLILIYCQTSLNTLKSL